MCLILRIITKGIKMKTGDIVRFAKWEEVFNSQWRDSSRWHVAPKNHLGILVDNDKLMKTAQILYEGEILKVRSVFVQKAGEKDFEKEIK